MKKKNNKEMSVDVIIPTYRPGADFLELIQRLQMQEYSIRKIIVINTESDEFPDNIHSPNCELEVIHIQREEFDHGSTRNMGAKLSEADVVLFMTQDALPADEKLVGALMKMFEDNFDVGIAYARQLPKADCNIVERYTRAFNYPAQSKIKTKSDLERMGIKTFFCSDVCAAYRREYLLSFGGFAEPSIFNEDMIFAGKRILAGDKVAYVADAKVFHSHNYTGRQQFHRNFDLAVSQAQHPEVFANTKSEGEGIKLVKKTILYLIEKRRPMKIVYLVHQSACKYFGYFLGKRYKKLPRWLILKCTSDRKYWEMHKDFMLVL